MKIRCDTCDKKIGIDDAFAGGVCRCPYCNAITYVPKADDSSAPRSRPAAPGARPAKPTGSAAAGVADVPVAHPVRVQAWLGIIALAALMAMIATIVTIVLLRGDDPNDQEGPSPEQAKEEAEEHYRQEEERTAKLKAPNVLGVPLTGPVMYCIDGAMRPFDSAQFATLRSVATLSAEHKFNVIVWRAGGYSRLSEGWTGGGGVDESELSEFMVDSLVGDLAQQGDALAAAAEAGARQIVIFASQSSGALTDIAATCTGKTAVIGVLIEADILGATEEAAESLKALAEKTGGTFRSLTPTDVADALRTGSD